MKKILSATAAATSLCIGGLLALSLAGCSDVSVTRAKAAAEHDLKDPASSQFREIRTINRATTDKANIEVVCGEVNSKNGYGAYGGYTPFYFVMNHTPAKVVPDGGHPVLTSGHVEVASDDAPSQARVKKLCNAKDTIPLQSGEYDYGWKDPCGGPDGGDISSSLTNYLAAKKFGKNLACEVIKYDAQTQPNVYTMSSGERSVYLAKIQSYLPVAQFIDDQNKLSSAKAQSRDAEDKKRPTYDPPL